MPDFLEKLKKGMNLENIPQNIQSEEVKPIEIAPVQEPIQEQEVEAVFTSAKVSTTEPKATVKKEKLKVKKEKPAKIQEKKKSSPLFEQEGELTVDVFETENNIVIQSAIAGIDLSDLEISIEKDMIAIKGTRERKFKEETKNYYCQECYWGRFSREIILPVETDTTKADAVIKNGILTITVPKVNKEKNKKLNIKNVE